VTAVQKKHNKNLVAGLGLLLLASWPYAWCKGAPAKSKMSPLQLVQAGKYAEALPGFKQMAAKSPRDPSINYYLGLCAESVRDYDLAESAFCRVVVGTSPASPFVPLAQRQLAVLPHKLEPQCTLTNGKLCRWDKGRQVRIFVSDGRTIPNTGSGLLPPERYSQVVEIARNNMASLKVAPSYKPTDSVLIAEGIRGWDWAVREKLFSYTFVRDPRAADIIILSYEGQNGNAQYPYDKGQPLLSWAAVGPERTEQVRRNHIRVLSAREFGHCLGLWHGNAKQDLMLEVCNIVEDESRQAPDSLASANDKASLRALYSMPADVTF
jgi:hypothetical protein